VQDRNDGHWLLPMLREVEEELEGAGIKKRPKVAAAEVTGISEGNVKKADPEGPSRERPPTLVREASGLERYVPPSGIPPGVPQEFAPKGDPVSLTGPEDDCSIVAQWVG